jgi:hypothetical protein
MLHDKSLGENPVHSWTSVGGASGILFFLWRHRFLRSAMSSGVCVSPMVQEGGEEVGS